MKQVVTLALVLLCCASLAFAQAGSIGLFGDPGGTNCNVYDTAPGLVSVYVVHVLSPGAIASQFKVESQCNLMTYLSDTGIYPVTIGSSPVGVAIGYGVCVPSPNHILTINYFASGITPPCCPLNVVGDPLSFSGQVEVVDCVDNLLTATGGTAIINPTSNCMCDVPAEDTTWGKVKAIFSE